MDMEPFGHLTWQRRITILCARIIHAYITLQCITYTYTYTHTHTHTHTHAHAHAHTHTHTYIYICIHIYIYIYADLSHLQGERAREKVALTILLHSGGSSLASNASRRLRRRLLLHSGSSVKCPAAPLPEAFAAFWTLSKSFSSGFRKQR